MKQVEEIMERAIYKIGQEVEITEDFEFETLGGRKFKVSSKNIS